MNIYLAFTFTFSNRKYNFPGCLWTYPWPLLLHFQTENTIFLGVYEHLLGLYFYIFKLKIQFSWVFMNISSPIRWRRRIFASARQWGTPAHRRRSAWTSERPKRNDPVFSDLPLSIHEHLGLSFQTNTRVETLRLSSDRLAYCSFLNKLEAEKESWVSASKLIKKKTKFFSYLRKFRCDRAQSHIWGRAS